MIDQTGIKGVISYQLLDEHGNVKQSGTTNNIVTVQGNAYYVDQLSDSGGAQASLMCLGTGDAAVGTTDTWVGGYFSGNGGTAGTAGGLVGNITTHASTANILQYVGTFAAGYATQDGITRVGITNLIPSADGNGTTNASTTFFVAHGTISPTVNKGASDTLVVTWLHTFSGS
jgi:hypothetical protein